MGQKAPLKIPEIHSIRIHLEMAKRIRDLALFNLAIDSKLRGIDLVGMRPVQFEITQKTRDSLEQWINVAKLGYGDCLFPSARNRARPLSTRQYAKIAHAWFDLIGLDSSHYGTHTLRRTKATIIYRQTKNLRAVQLLLGHTKIESTVRYLGIEVDDALDMSENVEI